MATTTNFGWTTPDDTALVKDGAAAIRTLGSSIDTSFVDLKGGTTGQVLAKNSGTDLDFVWSSDQVGIPASTVDAKGDIIAATAADTVSRLAVGANDTVLTADSTAATGLKWAAINAGGMTLLSTTTLSGASTVISSINQTYTSLFIYVMNPLMPGTSVGVACRINNAQQFRGVYTDVQGTSAPTNNRITTEYIELSKPNTLFSNSGDSGFGIWINNYTSGQRKPVSWSGSYANTSDYCSIIGGGATTGTSAVSSLAFSTSSGSFTGGTIYIYGVK